MLALHFHQKVIESKPDDSLHDFRLNDPWPELKEHLDRINLSDLDDYAHGHIPYIIILYHALKLWKDSHEGKLPQNFKEKDAFKGFVLSLRRVDTEANFAEASKECKYTYLGSIVPDRIRSLFEREQCNQLSCSSDPFWICVNALKQFVEKFSHLPLRGSLADMESDTQSYQALQALYKAQAAREMEIVSGIVNEILSSLGKDPSVISQDYIASICQNAHFLGAVTTRSLSQELEPTPDNGELISKLLFLFCKIINFNSVCYLCFRTDNAIEGDMYQTPVWYLIFRGVHSFYELHQRIPGAHNDELDSDIPLLKVCFFCPMT